MQTDFSVFLEKKYLDWQQGLGRRATLTEFAEYLGIDRTLLSHYLNLGHLPTREMAQRIAKQLGPEVFILAGDLGSDPSIAFLFRHWQNVPPDVQKQILEMVERFAPETRG